MIVVQGGVEVEIEFVDGHKPVITQTELPQHRPSGIFRHMVSFSESFLNRDISAPPYAQVPETHAAPGTHPQ